MKNQHRYSNYLELRKNYWEMSELPYDTIKDFTFDQWFDLKKGAALKKAVPALIEEMDLSGFLGKRLAICISDDSAMHELGEEKASLLQVCEENSITVLWDNGDSYYNYQNDREYYIREQTGTGAADDAETYLFLWWEMLPTAEEAKEKKLCQLHEKRKKLLQKGQFACRKYCLNRMDQLEQLEKRLKEMKDGLKKIELELGEDAESKAQKLKLYGRIRALEMHQKEMAAARVYLLAQSEPEKKK